MCVCPRARVCVALLFDPFMFVDVTYTHTGMNMPLCVVYLLRKTFDIILGYINIFIFHPELFS